MSLVTNHLKLAKQSQTYEVLTPTLLKKNICRKDIAEGEKNHSNSFQTFPGSDLSIGAKVKGSEEQTG